MERWSHIAYGLQGLFLAHKERRDMRRTTSKARLDIFDKRLKELTHSRKRTEQTFFENLDANIQKIKDYYRDRIDQLAQQNEKWMADSHRVRAAIEANARNRDSLKQNFAKHIIKMAFSY